MTVTNNKNQIQKFRFRHEELKYRILPAGLRKYESIHGHTVEESLRGSQESIIRILYYCVCWKGRTVTEDQFVSEWRSGNISFRLGARDYGLNQIYKLVRDRALYYRRKLKI